MSDLKFDSVPDGNTNDAQVANANSTVEEIMSKLKEPFPADEIDWRVQRSMKTARGDKAIVLAYLNARAVMDRLDDVVGANNWTDTYDRWGDNGVKCCLTVRLGNKWITKEDGADDTDIEATKGGFSSSFKRAAVKFGIGRYLYKLKESWVDISDKKQTPNDEYINDKKTGITGYWTPPTLPDWALPAENASSRASVQRQNTLEDGEPDSAPEQEQKQKAKPASLGKPAAEPQKNAILKMVDLANDKGKEANLDKLLAEIGRSSIHEVTTDDAKQLIARLNGIISS